MIATTNNAPPHTFSPFSAHWMDIHPRPPLSHTSTKPCLADSPQPTSRMLLAALAAAGDWTPLSALCEQLSLSRPTVTKLLRHLEQGKLVESTISDHSRAEGGRPPVLYRRPPESTCVIALRTAHHHVEGMLLDTCGQIRAHRVFPCVSPDDIIDVLTTAYAALSAHTQARIITVSIAVMGIVRPDGSVESGHFPRLNVPQWREDFSAFLPPDTPLLVANDAKLAAHWMDAQARHDGITLNSFIAMECSHALGCALVLRGSVWEGEHGAAGEVALTRSGQWANALNLLHYWDGRIDISQAYRRAAISHPMQVLSPSLEQRAAKALPPTCDAAPEELQFISAFGSAIGHALTPLVLLLDPTAVVIGGEAAWAGETFRQQVSHALAVNVPSPPEVHLSTGRERCVINGAAHLALREADQRLTSAL